MLNELAKQIHANAVDKGFYDEPLEFGTHMMLAVQELGEAMNAHQHDKRAAKFHPVMLRADNFIQLFEQGIKDTVEDELVDALQYLFGKMHDMGMDIDFYMAAKMQYNRTRPYKHGKKY